MNKVYLGFITSTHGIKGEIKIKSSFEYKDKAFKPGNKVYIEKEELKLDSEVLDDELLEYKVSYGDKVGFVKEVFFASPTNKIIRVLIDAEEVLVPYNDLFVRIDKNNKIIYINLIDGMIL